MRFFSMVGCALLVASGPSVAQTFNGYPCTQDCSGHQAGYDWAAQKGVNDISGCGGNSNSFIEGCQSYVEENDSTYGNSYDDSDGEENEE